MKKIFFSILIISQSMLYAQLAPQAKTMSDPNFNAAHPALTTDERGNPVLSWVEKNDSNEVVGLYFSVSKDGGKTFSDRKSVHITEGVSSHAEGMPKVVFKADGTIIGAFGVKRVTPQTRFASDLMFVESKDGGATWTNPQYLHTDTTRGKGRSFFDMTRLPNGEIGFSWLGETPEKGTGRPLRFRQTLKTGGLSAEITAKEGVCQCCRTNLFVDTEGGLHIFFRDILPDGSRDIGHVVSKDAGNTFESVGVVHADNWKINACPHTGPSSASLNNQLFTAWYTGETSQVGVKVSDSKGRILTQIKSPTARHPQMIALNNQLVLAWDEPDTSESDDRTAVKLRFLDKNGLLKNLNVTTGESAAYPSLLANGRSVVVAYESGENKKVIRVKSVR
jgi:BNR repeat-like domain